MIIWKFGGSTLADPASLRRVAALVGAQADRRPVLVCSALTGVTDALASAAQRIRRREFRVAQRELAQICARHLAVLAELRPAARDAALGEVQEILARLQNAVHAAAESGAGPAWAADLLACGERLSARLLAIALGGAGVRAQAVDASAAIITTADFECAAPLWEPTRAAAGRAIMPLIRAGVTPVVTGFFGATPDGRVTLLGRNTSDYSAAILAHALDAAAVCLWKDVDGIFSGDPRRGGGKLLRRLSYDQAQALLDGGARVVHRLALGPLREKNIPLEIRNATQPDSAGTRIEAAARAPAPPAGLLVEAEAAS